VSSDPRILKDVTKIPWKLVLHIPTLAWKSHEHNFSVLWDLRILGSSSHTNGHRERRIGRFFCLEISLQGSDYWAKEWWPKSSAAQYLSISRRLLQIFLINNSSHLWSGTVWRYPSKASNMPFVRDHRRSHDAFFLVFFQDLRAKQMVSCDLS
jgi:hypothetical protein